MPHLICFLYESWIHGYYSDPGHHLTPSGRDPGDLDDLSVDDLSARRADNFSEAAVEAIHT